MFNSISWQQFLTTMVIMLAAYYGLAIPGLYYKEILQWIKNGQKPPVAPETEEHIVNLVRKIQPDTARPSRKEIVTSEELIFAPTQKPDSEFNNSDPDRIISGSVADLLQEINTLADSIVENSGASEEAAAMFQSLLARYPAIKASALREAVTLVLHTTCKDTCHFDFDLQEIKKWWDV
jgi:hypothetical protein